jgi:4-hydroxyproline epimerase
VPAYRARKDVAVDVPGYGRVHGDVAWGGNWFFLVHDAPVEVVAAHIPALSAFAGAVMDALAAQGIAGDGGAAIDHVEVFGPTPTADSRSFVLCPGAAYDRSPCGTGTSAKLACLAADGKLAPGARWVQESVIGSRFEASYAPGPDGAVIPTITGTAYVTADASLVASEDDPFRWGIRG